jgi:hypothetical protein
MTRDEKPIVRYNGSNRQRGFSQLPLVDAYLRLGRHSTGDSGFAGVLGEPIVRTTSTTDRVGSSRPEVVLSIDRACMPHDGGQHGSEETRSQPHHEQRYSCLEVLKAEGMLVSRRGKYPLLQKTTSRR